MRRFIWLICAAFAVAGAAAFAADTPEKAEVGKPVADFKLPDLTKGSGGSEASSLVALSSFKGKKNVVLFFASERCSVTWRYEKRVGKLLQDFGKKDVAIMAVRCSANDTPEGIVKFAETKNFAMPVLNDEKGEMTKFFGITNTPTFVLIDKQGVLRYRGSYDDHADEAAAKKAYLPDAIQAVLAGKEVAVAETRPFG